MHSVNLPEQVNTSGCNERQSNLIFILSEYSEVSLQAEKQMVK
jgi:hypothetical protein